jgi:hypothetical protein
LTRALAVAGLLIALAGCAHSSDKQQQPRTTPRPQPRDPANEPLGRLSPSEKRAIVREYRLLQPLENGADDSASLARGRKICAALTAPDTTLVARVRADCNNAIVFFASLRGLERAGDECGQSSERDRLVCARKRFLALAKAVDVTSSGAAAINQELRRRGISGLCARSIGITESQLASYRRAEQAARDGADALAVGDSLGLQRATDELTNELTGGGNGDPLKGIERGCAVAKRKPLPRVPSGDGVNA